MKVDGRQTLVCQSVILGFYLYCFYSVTLRLLLVKLGLNDGMARGKVAQQILNICIS